MGIFKLKSSLRRQRSVVGTRSSKLKCVPVQFIRKKQCRGSKKSTWRIQSTILRHRRLFHDGVFPIFETLGARIATALKKINPELESQEENLLGRAEGSKGGSVPSWQADSLHDLRVLSGHKHSRVHPRFFRSDECNFYVEMMAKVLIQDGMKFSYRL